MAYGWPVPKHNYIATAAPGVGDDLGDGYEVGSVWIDITNDAVYICVDQTTGTAVWLTVAGAGVSSFPGMDFSQAYNSQYLSHVFW